MIKFFRTIRKELMEQNTSNRLDLISNNTLKVKLMAWPSELEDMIEGEILWKKPFGKIDKLSPLPIGFEWGTPFAALMIAVIIINQLTTMRGSRE